MRDKMTYYFVIGKGTAVWVWNKKEGAYEINDSGIKYGKITKMKEG